MASFYDARSDGGSHMVTKLNLGCGFDKKEGFLNVDHMSTCEPDLTQNLEDFPWALETNGFDYILMKHVLEHLGADFQTFKQIMQELYRITQPNGIIEIHVPHYRHDSYWSDPTHVRAFTPFTFQMMSKRQNDAWIEQKGNYTMLAYAMDVDFELEDALQIYDADWLQKVESGEITRDQMRNLSKTSWGVVKEIQVKMRAIK
jgi:predicted SAM-dependent methyltransferase